MELVLNKEEIGDAMSQTGKALKNKVVLITGASGGLGEQVAYQAAKLGAVLVLTARREEQLRAVQIKCKELSGVNAYFYVLDVGNPLQVSEVLDKIKKDVGNIDVLVNNAGFGMFREALDTDQNITEEMFRVNVLGLIQITKTLATDMKNQGSGHIINISSQAGKMATPKSAVYAATKFAVRGYSNALRLELKPFGIYVTTVNPGPIATEFFANADQGGTYLAKLDRWVLNSEEVAKIIVDSIFSKRREINLPRLMEIGARFYVIFPKIGDYFAATIFNRK